MHHVSLDGTWPYNSNFNNQVIKSLRLQPWEHRHLRATFNLEHADRIGTTYHLVHRRIILSNIRQGEVKIVMLLRQVECLSDACEHTQREYIDLHESQRVDVVLVPFNVRPVFHPCIKNRTEVG